MAKINDTTTYPNTTPALTDHFPGTDVSNTTNDANGETVTFTLQAAMDLFEANMTVPTSVSSAYLTSTILASTATGEGASLIGIEDAAGDTTATNVEAALVDVFGRLGDLDVWNSYSPTAFLQLADVTERVYAFNASGNSSATRPSGYDCVRWYNHGGVKPTNATSADIYDLTGSEVIQIVCSPAGDDLTTGTGKVTFRMPFAMTLTDVRASVATAPTGAALTVDINESGTTVLSTKLTIDASEKTSTTAATAAVISDSALADDAEITIDIDQVGSTIAGTDLIVTLYGDRA